LNEYVTNGSALLGCKSPQPSLELAWSERENLQPEEEQMRLESYLATSSSHPDDFLDTTHPNAGNFDFMKRVVATHVDDWVLLQDVAPDTITKLGWETKER
jgi:hypothetical protein